jgi:FtsH-binding integral membrane protein
MDEEVLLSQEKEYDQIIQESKIDQLIRKGFIYKVYSLLLIQLGITFGFVVLANEIKSIAIFILSHYYIYILMIIVPFIILIYFAVKPEKARQVPINYILLFIFCLSEAYTLVRFTIYFQRRSIYFSMLLTLIAVLALTIYAYKTEKDFSMIGGTLFVILVTLIIGEIINILFFRLKILYVIFNLISLGLFSLYLIHDTQLIIGNKTMKLSEDDYILAVINLYLDIIILFIDILSLFGDRR